ncbi:MAG: flagella basal body P-ring formation protein FlgA [Deltaproteobacteria bacterium]|nr:flagella basal body P-ring formation protein FlgA [Deltaproteobacteria bacterium]
MIPDLPPVEASLVEWAAEVCDATRVEVHFTGLSAAGDGPFTWGGDPCRARPDLRLHIDDRSLTVRPHLTVWVAVEVAAADIPAGGLVVSLPGEVPIEDLRGARVHGALVARGAISAGTPITAAVARVAPDAARDAEVTLVVQRGALQVGAPGRLLQEAHLGDRVRVINLATDVVLTGTLASTNTVLIP